MPDSQHTATDTAFTSTVRSSRAPPALRVIHSPDLARVGGVAYAGTRELIVGRESGGSGVLQLADRRLSRVHAGFRVSRSDVLTVVDHGSKNGCFVSGRPVDRAPLTEGSVIRLGDNSLVAFREHFPGEPDHSGIAGISQSICRLRDIVKRVAPSALSTLVNGPTGTVKEIVARTLHTLSGRRGAFVAITCAALPESLVESTLFGHQKGAFSGAASAQDGAFNRANGGTLFLDEVGEMALTAQPKLLRALELVEITPVGASRSVTVDTRVVSATNRPLGPAMAAGQFRDDLFARLAGVEIDTPTLVERPDDVLVLLNHFWAKARRAISADFAESLVLWSWPHNVRELKRLSERLLVLHPGGEQWEPAHLTDDLQLDRTAPVESAAGPPFRPALPTALEQHQANVKETAVALGRSRCQLYRWMDQHGIARGFGR